MYDYVSVGEAASARGVQSPHCAVDAGTRTEVHQGLTQLVSPLFLLLHPSRAFFCSKVIFAFRNRLHDCINVSKAYSMVSMV